MKKLILCLLTTFFANHFFAQNLLHDVNYDSPKNIQAYDENTKYFQAIFLQYETAVATLTEKVRQDEKAAYQAEIAKIRQESLLRSDEAIAKAREDIYQQEIENVRELETERLTSELTKKITQELNIKLSAEYESKKNAEIEALKKDLKKQIFKEVNAGTQRTKIIALHSAIAICFALFVIFVIWCIRRYSAASREKNKKKTLVEEYLRMLKSFDGDTTRISTEINKKYSGNDEILQFHKDAFNEAIDRYSNVKTTEEYQNKFTSLKNTLNLCVANWKEENSNQIFPAFEKSKNDFSDSGYELFLSLDKRSSGEKDDAKLLLNASSKFLEEISEQIAKKELNEEWKSKQENLSKEFKDLSQEFEKWSSK